MSAHAPPTDPTHELLARPADCDYVPAVRAVVESARPFATAAVVVVDPTEFAADRCDPTVRSAVDRLCECFETVPEAERSAAYPIYRGRLPHQWDTLDAVFAERPSTCLSWGLREIELRGDEWLSQEVPHHSTVAVNVASAADPEEFRRAIQQRLVGLDACLVPAETRTEWTTAGRTYRIDGGSLCVASADGSREKCLGLAGIDRINPDASSLVIDLEWWTERDGSSLVGRVLSGAVRRLTSPPTRLEFDDRDSFDECLAVLEEIHEAYRS